MTTSPKERPILFNGPMVRAILAGTKTQTRRPVKDQPGEGWDPVVGYYHPAVVDRRGELVPGPMIYGAADEDDGRRSPFGAPGDRLWVRETWQGPTLGVDDDGDFVQLMHYAATDAPPVTTRGPGKWRPSIHMPRWASRITLEITGVRVERLQAITREDAIAEGLPRTVGYDVAGGPERWFQATWQNTYGAESWASSPWVWCVSFRRVEVPRE